MVKRTLKPLYKKIEGEIPASWNPKKFEQVIDAIDEGGTPPRANGNYFNGKIAWVVIEDIKRNIYETKEYLSEEGLKNCNAKLWPKDTLILSFGATIGEVGIGIIPVTTKQGIAGIIAKDSETTVEFLFYLFQHYKNVLIRFAHQTTLSETRPSTIKQLMFPFPPLPEQSKIASILSTVDDNIEKVDERITKTEQFKKGLMQRLLTKGIGHTKFKKTEIGKIPEEWEVKHLADNGLFSITSGGTPSTNNPKYWENGTIPWVGPTEVSNLEGNYLFETEKKITDLGLKESSTVLLPKGTVLMTSRATVGDVTIAGIEVCTNQGFMNFICNEDKIHNLFLLYILKKLKERISWLGGQSTFKEVRKRHMKKIIFGLPLIPEQSKIASILSSVDDKIQNLKKKKEKLELLKKGMMQVLLTGKVRVKVN